MIIGLLAAAKMMRMRMEKRSTIVVAPSLELHWSTTIPSAPFQVSSGNNTLEEDDDSFLNFEIHHLKTGTTVLFEFQSSSSWPLSTQAKVKIEPDQRKRRRYKHSNRLEQLDVMQRNRHTDCRQHNLSPRKATHGWYDANLNQLRASFHRNAIWAGLWWNQQPKTTELINQNILTN
jgi:hypothetical protein